MLAKRIATAVILLVAFVAALLLLPNGWWAAVLVPPVIVASWEWCTLARFIGVARWMFVGSIVVSGAILWAVIHGAAPAPGDRAMLETLVYLVSGLFWLAFALPRIVRRQEIRSPLALGVAGWLLLVPTWLALARLQVDPERLLALLGVVWLSDTAAFLTGRTWGRHRLAPQISPGKTWEGIAGAAAAVAVYYVGLSRATPDWAAWAGWGGALLFALVAAMGVVGDLFESWVKRLAGVKDSGALLPGHGGILDRIDSMTAALPVAALLLPYAV